jgi:hypothetical protein
MRAVILSFGIFQNLSIVKYRKHAKKTHVPFSTKEKNLSRPNNLSARA